MQAHSFTWQSLAEILESVCEASSVARTPVPGLRTAFAGLVDTVPKAQWYIFLNSDKVFTGSQCGGSGRCYPEPIYYHHGSRIKELKYFNHKKK